MSAPTHRWKLGLFIVVGVIAALTTVVVLGARSLKKATVAYITFFDESVQGLDVGSPVKFRGVTVGNVSKIDVAPDHRHVAVTCQLDVADLDTLRLTDPQKAKGHILVPPDLRAQLGSAGITGVKFILIDFFPVADHPVPVLPFKVPENTIPVASSTMKNLEDAVVRAVNRIPEVAEELLVVMKRVNKILEDVDAKHLPEGASATLGQVNEAVKELRVTIKDVDAKGLTREAQQTMVSVNTMLAQTTKVLERIQGEGGVLAGAERTTNAFGDVARNASGLGLELEETLRDIQGAAATIQRLGDALDKDGDMLLKGRSKSK